jgi:hypothetical protein
MTCQKVQNTADRDGMPKVRNTEQRERMSCEGDMKQHIERARRTFRRKVTEQNDMQKI